MDSLNPPGIDQRFDACSRAKRMRGISNATSSDDSAISTHDSKFRDGGVRKLNSEASLSESSDHSSGETGRQIHIPVGDDIGENRRSSTSMSHGLISVIGRRRVMEDAFAVAKFDSYHFFAVYDGHGGIRVANACRDRLHQLVEEEWRLSGDEVMNWEKVMAVSFSKMDQEVGGGHAEVEPETSGETTNADKNMTGSTAVMVLVGEEEIVVANCGDSRAVLWRGGAAVPLSRDHKPDRPDEMERIEAAGGRIIDWNGCRVLGVLATSRSIGDHYLKPYVIPEPEVTVCKRTESDEFIVIATDGLWDVVSNEFACEVVRRCLDAQIKRRFPEGFSGSAAAAAATMLAELAMARGSKDNISIIVVELNK